MKINKDTKIYGSFSNNPGNNGCIFFNEQFDKYDINAIYKSFYSTNPEKLIDSVKHLNFSGFALSMPLKISIVSYLHKVDKAAQQIGAVNTVINENGILTGYNTDWLGVYKFITTTVNMWFPLDKPVIILGNGGFSRAIQYALNKLDVKYRIIERKDWDEIPSLTGVIFNATPVDVEIEGEFLIDGRPFTPTGKVIAKLQAEEQFKLYTGIKIE